MAVEIKRVIEAVRDWIAGVEIKIPFLSSAEQTKLSWARMIHSYDEVPEIYRSFFEELPGGWDVFPYAVLTPSYEGFLTKGSEKLVFCLDGKVWILERVKDALVPTSFSFEDVSYVEVGEVLLQSWVTIRGLAGDGVLTSSTLKCSSVTLHLLTPIVESVRLSGNRTGEADLVAELSKFDYLKTLNLKLMNYARRSLLPGQKVVSTVLQPEIRVEVLKLFGRAFYRVLSPAHISILTDRELILIKDGMDRRVGGGVRYGGVWSYIPLDKIAATSLEGKAGDTLTLSIRLPGDDCIEALLSASNKPAAESLLGRLAGSKPD
jgi:hypothetical protein